MEKICQLIMVFALIAAVKLLTDITLATTAMERKMSDIIDIIAEHEVELDELRQLLNQEAIP